MNDVRDILDIGDDSCLPSTTKKPQKKCEPFKRPEGMARELYALLCADGGKNLELAPLLPTDTPGGYKQKLNLGAKSVRKWKWTPFTNPARRDGAVFYHWKRIGEEHREYPFAKFNREIPVLKYSESEYGNHLEKDGWTKDETDHLFSLATRFDLRFPIIHDRYGGEGNHFPTRTLEDIKERYYGVSAILSKLRAEPGTEPKVFHFDGDHERRRKEQLNKLWNRTPEQVEEEDFLRAELKRIEARKKEREKKTQDLQKLITAADGGGGGVGESGKRLDQVHKKSSNAPGIKKRNSVGGTKGISGGGGVDSTPFYGLKWPDFKNPGITTRSGRMRLPVGIGQKKAKVVEAKLKELGVDTPTFQNEETSLPYNDIRSDIILHYELRSLLSTCEMELQSYKHQYEAMRPGETLIIPRELEPTLLSTNINKETVSTNINSQTVTRTDAPLLPPIRKRKAAIEQGKILRRLKNKM